MDTKDTFRDRVQELLSEELVNEDGVLAPGAEVDTGDMADRIMNIAESFFDTPDGLVEVRANLEKTTVEPGKKLKIAVTALNTPENRMRLFSLQDSGLTLRGCQYEIPMESAQGGDTEPSEDDDDHPGQTTLEEWEEGYPESQVDDDDAEGEEPGEAPAAAEEELEAEAVNA